MIVYYQDRDIYDGWCAEYNTETKEVKLRDHYRVSALNDVEKRRLINDCKLAFEDNPEN